jgi:hypothetical protein
MSDSIDLSDIDINIGVSDDTITGNSSGYPSAYYSTVSGFPSGGISSIGYPVSSWASSASSVINNSVSGQLTIVGENPDIKFGDRSLVDFMDKVEERLGILRPNEELENRWDQLKELRKQYVELEKDLIEKEKMWELLKKE